MHKHRFRETKRLARQTLDAGAESQMFPLNLLGVDFTDCVRGGRKMAVVDSSGICIEVLRKR